MRFLVDASLSPEVAAGLREAGHDAMHLRERGLQAAPDPVVLDLAAAEGRVVVTADTDFGTLLAVRGGTAPSVVLFRRATGRRPGRQVTLLVSALTTVGEALEVGAVVVFDERRVRIRSLPIGPEPDGG